MRDVALTATQRSFIDRYVRKPGQDGRERAAHPSQATLLTIWQKAKDGVDARLERLRAALLAHDDPGAAVIAQSTLFSVGKSESVSLIAALRAYDAAGQGDRPAQQVRDAIRSFRTNILASETVSLIDTAPFGVDVDMRGQLSSSLQSIEARL